jgi:uncharacterized protein YprB with RNaseH-like and TPR domain
VVQLMQVDAQSFLRLTEAADTLAFVDIEATGLRGDYNSVLVVSIKPFQSDPITYTVKQPGNDKGIVRAVKEHMETLDVWVTYYGKGFDLPMLNTRLLKWGYGPIEKRPHVDMYYSLKSNLLTARRSQGHLLSWLGTPEEKMTVGADQWNAILADPKGKPMKIMVERCESDVIGLQGLYARTKHVIRDITR